MMKRIKKFAVIGSAILLMTASIAAAEPGEISKRTVTDPAMANATGPTELQSSGLADAPWSARTPLDVLKNDFSIFYKDLQAIPYFAGGGVAAVGDAAFNINVPDYYIPAISAARYGKGRIVVAGSKEYFNLSGSAGDPAGKLARNILWWLTDDASTNQGQGNDHTNRYEDALRKPGKKIRLITTSAALTVNSDLPIELVKIDSWASVNLNPQKYAVAYVDHTMKDKDLEALGQYLRLGGGIVVADNLSGIEGITRDTPEEIVLQVGNLRGARLSRDFAIQKLLNRAGLTLMNRGSESNVGESALTYEQANDHHIKTRLAQGKEVEEGTITYDQINIGPPGTPTNKKQERLYNILNETLETLSSESPLYAWADTEADSLPPAEFPIQKFQQPYTNALHNFRFSHFTLDKANEKSPYADAFPGVVSEEAAIVNDREVEVDFDFPNTMYTHALPSKNWISTGLYAPPGKVITLEVPQGVEHLTVQIVRMMTI